jgi:PAS domain S-box-containing protein
MTEPFLPDYEATINLSLIIDHLPTMIYRRKNDPDWSMEYVSFGSQKITGYQPFEFLSPAKISYKSLLFEEDKKTILNKIDIALTNKTPFTINYRINDNRNNVKWIFERGEGIYAPDNKLVAVEGFIADISQEKSVQKKYDEMLSLLNSAINAIGEGILVVNTRNKITYYNTKFLKMWKIPEALIALNRVEELVKFTSGQLKDKKIFIESVVQLSHEPYMEGKEILELKDGRYIERFSRPQIMKGKAVGRVWSFLDVTERVLFDDLLSKERDLLQALMNNIPDTIYFKDKESKFTRINKAQAKLLGVNHPSEAMGKTDFDYFEPEHARQAFEDEQKMMESKEGLIAKVEKIRCAGGEYRWVTATKVPFLDKDGNVTGLVGISRDITSSKIAEEKLAKYSQELNELNASKDKLFSIIAHDLRSPFGPLLGLSEILDKDYDSLSTEEIKDYNHEINRALKNQFGLLEDLLNWSRMETGKIIVSKSELNLFEKVNKVTNLMNANAKNKNISLIIQVYNNPVVFADADMLHSIVQNLLSNAIKFTRPGGCINISSLDAGDFVEVTIEDNGIGIREEDIKNIFGINCFTTYGTNKEKGTGLGLLICKEMVEKNGGTIRVESVYGKGSKFIFTLPKPDNMLTED